MNYDMLNGISDKRTNRLTELVVIVSDVVPVTVNFKKELPEGIYDCKLPPFIRLKAPNIPPCPNIKKA